MYLHIGSWGYQHDKVCPVWSPLAAVFDAQVLMFAVLLLAFTEGLQWEEVWAGELKYMFIFWNSTGSTQVGECLNFGILNPAPCRYSMPWKSFLGRVPSVAACWASGMQLQALIWWIGILGWKTENVMAKSYAKEIPSILQLQQVLGF